MELSFSCFSFFVAETRQAFPGKYHSQPYIVTGVLVAIIMTTS